MIYNSRKEAMIAQQEFIEKLEKLEEEYGVSVTSDDDCAITYYEVDYFDENGKRQTYLG